jgi:hypothetical protein
MNITDPQPYLDEQGDACFKSAIAGSHCYLEYGSGGSTLYAANVARVAHILSVETDPDVARQIADSLEGSTSLLHMICADIGTVGQWGYPVSDEKIGEYWRYMSAPWNMAEELGLTPDMVMVDGRFRVASFLFSYVSAPEGATILFDDYYDRPHYWVVEAFCKPAQRHGRMAVFQVAQRNYKASAMCEMIAQYSLIVE